jgi:hypothetical protein
MSDVSNVCGSNILSIVWSLDRINIGMAHI